MAYIKIFWKISKFSVYCNMRCGGGKEKREGGVYIKQKGGWVVVSVPYEEKNMAFAFSVWYNIVRHDMKQGFP